MPPNLGGFFMVRSYYPSECHADYFDFERIEALKPARSEERFSRNAETDLVCRLLLEKKKYTSTTPAQAAKTPPPAPPHSPPPTTGEPSPTPPRPPPLSHPT